MKEYQKIVLSNGLRVITVPMEHVKSVTALLLVGAGSRYEEPLESGISHFTEHMVFKGTEKRRRAADIAGAIDAIGGEINAFTGEEYTGYYIKAESTHVDLVLDLLSDMILHSRFSPTEIERERGVIIEEINLYEDTPSRKVGEVYKQLLYADTPLGRPVAGSKMTVGAIKRPRFMRFMRELYVPQNAVFALAGNVPGTPASQVAAALDSWQQGSARAQLKVTDDQTKPAIALLYKPTEQAHLMIGVRTFPLGHPTRYAEGLFNVIMAGNMSSRLFTEVRERRGLAYAIRGSSDHFLDVGSWSLYAGCDLHKAASCVRVILDQLQRVAAKGVTNGELAKAKEFVVGKLALDLEDSQAVASMVATQELLEGRIRTPEELTQQVRAVTRQDISMFAQAVLKTEQLNVAVVGPFEDAGQFEELLAL